LDPLARDVCYVALAAIECVDLGVVYIETQGGESNSMERVDQREPDIAQTDHAHLGHSTLNPRAKLLDHRFGNDRHARYPVK
jgi:hypothetical protein